MYLHFFLLLFSTGVSSYILSLKETLHLEKKAQSATIEEIICLLKAENGHPNMTFSIPCDIMDQSCAPNNTENFIRELNKISQYKCMKQVEIKMEKLRDNCPILKKPSSHNCKCSGGVQKKFPYFKKCLEEFLRWVNDAQDCSNIVGNNSGLYQDGKCRCSKP